MSTEPQDRTGRAVTLAAITDENWRDVADVAPRDDQRPFVPALAARYLLLSARGGPWTSLAVLADGVVAGHLMWAYDTSDGTHWVGGMVIDTAEQGKGVGRAAVRAAIGLLGSRPGAREIRLSCHPDNVAAAALYRAAGFRPTDDRVDDEIVLALAVDGERDPSVVRAHADRATREAYDTVASNYARMLPDVSAEAPLDRAVLLAFAEMVRLAGDGLVAEVGCGSGRVTAHLADASLRIVGLDLSPGMVTVAQSARPDLGFAAADAAELPIRSGALAGLIAWYSLTNLPTDLLPGVFAGFARVLRPGAPVLVAFPCGEGQTVQRTSSYGHPVSLTFYRHRLTAVADALMAAGLEPYATVRREQSLVHETTPQAFLLAHRR